MRSYVLLFKLVAVMLLAVGVHAELPRPNILVILADDLGYSDLGCYGGEINTPTLNRLAENGIRFTQFYSAARCCPSRAALLTGLYPHQAGIGAMTGTCNPKIPAYQGYLKRESVTMGEALGQAGYRTFLSGKWHVGDHDSSMYPSARGFQRTFCYLGGACNYYDGTWPGSRQPAKIVMNGKPYRVPDDFFMTDTITDYAIDFIRETPSNQPVFGYISYTAPHWPLHARPETIAKYKGRYDAGWDVLRQQRFERISEMGLLGSDITPAPRSDGKKLVPAWNTLSPEKQNEMAGRMEVYAAQVEEMDQQIDRVLSVLKETGRYENTLLLFLSDNGACAEPNDEAFGKIWRNPDAPVGSRESFVSYGRGWAEVCNVPFRLFKSKIHEGGIRTPLIAHWPNGIQRPGRLDRQTGHLIDIMTTGLEVAGAEYPGQFSGHEIIPAEGISLAPVFAGHPRREHEVIAWEHFANAGIRSGDWKLTAETRNSPRGRVPGEWSLYNLAEDPTEMNNQAGKYPERVQELNRAYEQWAERVGVLESLSDWQKSK